MRLLLHHLRFRTTGVLTSLTGLLCTACLLMMTILIVILHSAGSAHHPVLLWLVTGVALAAIPLVIAGAMDNGTNARAALPALPLTDRARGCVESWAWLPAWILLVSLLALIPVAFGDIAPHPQRQSALPYAEGLLTAALLGLPMITLSGFLPALGSATTIPVTTLAAVEATCVMLGCDGLLGAAGLALVLTPIVVVLGPRIRRFEPITWSAREGARSRPPLAPTHMLIDDAVRGMGRSALKLSPWAFIPPAVALLLIVAGGKLGNASPASTTLHAGAAGLFCLLGGLIFFPLGLSGRTVGPGGLNGDMNGEFGRACSVLPISRRSVVLAVYLPGLAAALTAVAGLVVLTRYSGVNWVAAPSDAFVATLFAFAVLTPGLVTAGLLAHPQGWLRIFAGGALLAILAVTVVAAFTHDPLAIQATIGSALSVGVVLPCLLLRKP